MTQEHAVPPDVNPVVVLREEFDDWAVLYNPDTADGIGINPIAVKLWRAFEQRLSWDEIKQLIRAEYSQVPDDLDADLRRFTEALVDRGFLGVAVEP